jgi:dethiobiotin synthetase
MNKSYFITGTDTGVGKTRVAVGLLQVAHDTGRTVLGLKPVAAGYSPVAGIAMNDDARELQLASDGQPDYATVNPIALQEAIAPHIAAEREGRVLGAAALVTHCRQLAVTAQFTVVEGAGGWLVPLNDHETMADIAVGLGYPVILVVGMRLGCINHALLSMASIRRAGLQIAGWVANHIDPTMEAADANVQSIAERIDAPLIGRIPWLAEPTAANIGMHLDAGFLATPA